MASDQLTSAVPAAPPGPQPTWLARLGPSGKLLALGGLLGVISMFLPLLSLSVYTPPPGAAEAFAGKSPFKPPVAADLKSRMVVQDEDRRGLICLVGYLAALALSYVLYRPNVPDGLAERSFTWAGVGVALIIAVETFSLLDDVSNLSSFRPIDGVKRDTGIGLVLSPLAAQAVVVGSFLRAWRRR